MRVLVVLYHVGDELARALERAGADEFGVQVWCADWEDAITGCASKEGLGWLSHADSLVHLINRYHVALDELRSRSE